ncbi:MAG TPA: hypothetical protein VJ986_00375, partial [Gaiellaceae bacterium]|nr:hypothetical protein [Gaiellaceae bacterium]
MRVLIAAAGVVSLLAGGGAAGPHVQTLYKSPSGPIAAFAQDGSLLSWFEPGKQSCNHVQLLSLDGVRVTLPNQRSGNQNVTCRWNVTGPIRLALGGTRVLWSLYEQAPVEYDYVVGASVSDRRERRFQEIAHGHRGAGLWLGGVAGDGSTLVYSTIAVGYVNRLSCLSGGSCKLRVIGGSVLRVVGRRYVPIKGIGPTIDIAASGTRIAYIPAGPAVDRNGSPLPSPDRPIEVRDALTGAFVSRVEPAGVPERVALSPHVLAVLERTSRGPLVEWFDAARGGQRLGAVRLARGVGDNLSASDQLIAFHVGRSLRAIDVATHTVRVLAEAASTPIGLSLEGSRLAWAENV